MGVLVQTACDAAHGHSAGNGGGVLTLAELGAAGEEARDAACPVKKFFADTRKAISDWFYQTMPIAE